MKKKINKLSKKERIKICSKYYNKDFFDTCKNCPLQIDTIHCFPGVIEDLRIAKNKVADLEKLLQKVKDKEVETEDDEDE